MQKNLSFSITLSLENQKSTKTEIHWNQLISSHFGRSIGFDWEFHTSKYSVSVGHTHKNDWNWIKHTLIITSSILDCMSVYYYNLSMKIPFFSWFFLILICSLFVNFPIFVVFGQCRGDQQSYLLDMKDNLIFDTTRSTKLVHWNESTDCCSWEGVTCNGGLLVGINLVNESIYDGLDSLSSLFCLQYLQNLNLAYNKLDSPIPLEFGNLMNLRYLNLSYTDFGG